MTQFNIRHPHDSYFKIFFSHLDTLRSFLNIYVPQELLRQCDLTQLVPVPAEFVSSGLVTRFADLAYRTHLINKPDSYIYFVIEHQRRPDRRMPQRLWEYTARLMHAHERDLSRSLPIVYPIVLYNGLRPYPYSLSFWQMFKEPDLSREWMIQDTLLVDLNKVSDETIYQHGTLGVFEYLQKYSSRVDPDKLISNFCRLLRGTFLPVDLEDASWQYMFSTNQRITDIDEFYTLIKRYFNEDKERVMTLAQQLRQSGYLEGIEQGLEQGLEQGMQTSKKMIALNMLQAGLSLDVIISVTGLAEDEVKQLSHN